MLATYIFLSWCCYVINCSEEILDNPVAKTLYGQVRGRIFTSVHGKSVYAFQEIPYATPPVGEFRFKESVPPNKWEGILNTTRNTKICMETRYAGKVLNWREDEDCLYLNVYTPQLPSSNDNMSALPVFVYIYGGNFSFNDGTLDRYDPQLFVESGVVSVLFNFRSASLGFLSTNDGVIPANLGLKDQTLALKWIQGNIKFFGGDPTKVTLTGHSSGAFCVTMHLVSRRSAGLFRSAIIQSTGGLDMKDKTKNARTIGFKLGKAFSPSLKDRHNTNSSKELYRVLMNAPADILVNITIPIKNVNNWFPLLEDDDDPNAFLSESMFKDFINGSINAHSILMGLTSEEILRMQSRINIDEVAALYDKDIRNSLDDVFNDKGILRLEIARDLKHIYTKQDFKENIPALFQYMSDSQFGIKIIGWADLMLPFRDIYFYQFSYYGELNKFESENHDIIPGIGKVGHCEELAYLYYSRTHADVSDDATYPPSDILTRRRLVKLWTNFVKYQNPTPEKDDLLQNLTWPKLSIDKFHFLDIDADLTVNDGYPKPYARWVKILGEYYKNPVAAIARIPV